MTPTFIDLIRLSFVAPRVAARQVLGFPLRYRTLIEVAVLGIVLNTLVTQGISTLLAPAPVETLETDPPVPMITPFMAFGIDAILMTLTILAVHLIGGLFGGRGSLRESILVNAWIHYLMILVQLVAIVLTVIMPGLALLTIPLALGIFFYLLSNFVAEMHAFTSALGVFFGAIVLILILSFVITFLFLAGNAGLAHV